MTVVEVMEQKGGTARWIELRAHVSQRAIERAAKDGTIVRISRGVYRLPNRPNPDESPPGVYSHITAADLWELGALHHDPRTHVTVPSSTSRLKHGAKSKLKVHYADLSADDIRRNTTSPLRTVIDCARACDFNEALAIADTAVRLRLVKQPELRTAAAKVTGRGAPQARRVAAHCDPRSHSPLESALRAVLIDAGITHFVPQYVARTAEGRWIAQVDLGDPGAGVLLEADSFLFHGHRGQLERDARRYNALVSHGFLVLRFAYEHVLGDPGWVIKTVKRTLALRQ